MGKQLSYLIIGNGITGATAAEILRSEDTTCSITIVADDPYPVYYRPALKDYLGGRMPEEKLWARPSTFYQEQHIHFVPGRVVALNPAHHTVQLHNGQQLGYHKLLLANGARPRTLACPGLDLAGVTTLRTIADYQQILRRLGNTTRIVISGSGTLALESAETLRHRGYEVTHLLRNQMLWSEVLDPIASDMVLHEERRDGIDVRTGEEIAEIIGLNGQVAGIITTSGTRIPCEAVLIAIGIEPLTDFIQASGIACGRGVMVDTAMRTNAPDIYAAGDLIETADPLTKRTRVLGQWYPAIQQARIAAHHMLGMHYADQTGTFYNATFLYGLDFVSLGLTTPPRNQPFQEIVAEPQPRNYRKLLLQHGIPVGAILLGDRKQAQAFKRSIDQHVNLSPVLPHIFDEAFSLDDWLDQQNIPPTIPEIGQVKHTAIVDSVTLLDINMHEAQTPLAAVLAPITQPQLPMALKEMPLDPSEMRIPLTIGRQAGLTLQLEHPTVSRRHAEISLAADTSQPGQYVLRDMGSSYGTFVNNRKLTTQQTYNLQHNDLLRFGDIQFRFQLRSTPDVTNTRLLPAAKTALLAAPHAAFTHLADSALQNNTTQIIPESLLASLGATPTLVIVAAQSEARVYPLEQGKRISLGRDKANELVIDDTACSRRHAELFTAPDGFYIRDLSSSNGVFVNRVKINNPYHLLHGDRIVIGNTLLYLSFPSVRARTSTPTPALRSGKATALVTIPAAEQEQKQMTAGMAHRTDVRMLNPKHVNFEIDMCIGCNRCMSACPIPMSSMVSIADLNHATVTKDVAPHVARFTYECIMCGSCVPVCPVDNHRDLLMLSLKQRLGVSWDEPVDLQHLASLLPPNWTIPFLIERLREHPILRDTQRIPENYLLHLFAASTLLALPPKTTIIREGSYGRDLYLILEGSLVLVTTEMDEKELAVAIVQRGEYVGEYSMLTGQPYPSSARTQTQALILQIPEQVVQRFVELVPHVQHFLEQINAAHSIRSILKRMALFQGVSEADIHQLAEQTQVQHFGRSERLFAEEGRDRPIRESLHIILEGFVKVARHTAAGTGHDKTDERIIAYRQDGDYFAGGLDLLGDGRAVTVTSINRTRVAEVPRAALMPLFQYYPEVYQRFSLRLREYVESTASANMGILATSPLQQFTPLGLSTDAAVRDGLHSIVNDGVVEGTEVLVIDLDKCIHCNECEEACERRHGHSRMNRKGMVVGNISIATACRQCQDPVCMLCSRAGIARLPDGEVYITETCIGCGICAERCPYDAITIIDTNAEEEIARSSWERLSRFFKQGIDWQPKRKPLPMAVAGNRAAPSPLDIALPRNSYDEMRKKIAIKCDLCVGYKDQACVEACPMGAAFRVQPTTFFGSTEDILRRRVV